MARLKTFSVQGMLTIPTSRNTACAIIAAADVPQRVKPAMRVAAGAIAKKYLAEKFGIVIRGCLTQMAIFLWRSKTGNRLNKTRSSARTRIKLKRLMN
ncbi:chorismate synthase [Raoultella ornithinolytica]|nr:chorismate synthase [Raoultella ornithinolytica]